jgi:large subunit ribosomal protein L1
MAKQGKKYIAALKQVDENKLYSVTEAVKLLQKVKFTKFDETVTI